MQKTKSAPQGAGSENRKLYAGRIDEIRKPVPNKHQRKIAERLEYYTKPTQITKRARTGGSRCFTSDFQSDKELLIFNYCL